MIEIVDVETRLREIRRSLVFQNYGSDMFTKRLLDIDRLAVSRLRTYDRSKHYKQVARRHQPTVLGFKDDLIEAIDQRLLYLQCFREERASGNVENGAGKDAASERPSTIDSRELRVDMDMKNDKHEPKQISMPTAARHGDYDILGTLGKIAGIGGISVGALLILFLNFIRQKFLPNLNTIQAYNLLLLFMIFTFGIAVCGLAVWSFQSKEGGRSIAILLLCFALCLTALGLYEIHSAKEEMKRDNSGAIGGLKAFWLQTERQMVHRDRPVILPVSAVAALKEHKAKQEVFRRQFGPDYGAGLTRTGALF